MKRKTKKGSRFDLDSMSLKELTELETAVKRAISAKRDTERSELKRKMAEMAQSHGFSVGEIFPSGRGRPAGKGKSLGIAKYANPDNPSDTWTGRGRKPNWVLDRLKKGAKLADFAI